MSGSPPPPSDGRRDVGNGVAEKCFGVRGGGPNHRCFGALAVFTKRIADVDSDKLSPHWVRVVVIESESQSAGSTAPASSASGGGGDRSATHGLPPPVTPSDPSSRSGTRGEPPQPPQPAAPGAASPPQPMTHPMTQPERDPLHDDGRLGRHDPPFPGRATPVLPPQSPQSPAWPMDGDEVLRRAMSRRWVGSDVAGAGGRVEPPGQSRERPRRSPAEKEAAAAVQSAAETARARQPEPRPPVDRSITPGAPEMTAVANLRQAINTAVTTAVQTVRDPEFGQDFVKNHYIFIKGTLDGFFSGEPLIQAVKYSSTVLSGVAASTSKLASYTYEKGKAFLEENYK